MKVFKIDKMPVENSYEYISEFSNYDLEDLYKTNADVAFYCYATGSYEGQLLLFKDGNWFLHSCSHCSCYDPLDSISFNDPIGKTLKEVEKNCSENLINEVQYLISLAKEKGYK